MKHAFTLIELLVVITIIVVLLALLTPALDRAIYQAELAVCGANLKGIGTGANVYAANFKRKYPYRIKIHQGEGGQEVRKLYAERLFNDVMPLDDAPDDRNTIEGYIGLALLQDPLNEKVDRSIDGNRASTSVMSGYELWYGFRYSDALGGRGMHKVGDRFVWNGQRYRLLASDIDEMSPAGGAVADIAAGHPDDAGVMYNIVWQNQELTEGAAGLGFGAGLSMTFSWWENHETMERGLVDLNYVFDDGSVARINALEWNAGDPGDPDSEARVKRVPLWNRDGVDEDSWVRIPPR